VKTYVDTNLLVRMYLELPGCEEAVALLSGRPARGAWPFPVTDLLRFETINAFHRMVYESRTLGQWRVTPESAAMAHADFERDLSDGLFLNRSPLTLQDMQQEFEMLAARHTARDGYRTYDVMHVASARTMGCERFLTFDSKAGKLAILAGMKSQ
jgi:predicted nucleic acid-binding protein